MPEVRECLAHYFIILWFFQHYRSSTCLRLVALWADASKQEAKTIPAARDGHVYRLDATSTVTRGTNNAQTSLWPPMWRQSSKRPDPPSIQSLELNGVSTTSRAIILDMGPLSLKLSYLTHTSVQIYTKSVWYDSICKVDKSQRKFHVALAMEFEEYVLAFLSHDMVYQPIWFASGDPLPPAAPDVHTDYENFLTIVADWIRQRSSSRYRRAGLACEEIRKANMVWGGVGVYTVSEIFFDSGLSPFLTEQEVFDCPSRTARLCEAYWSFVHRSHSDLESLLRPCIKEGILAPTENQRLGYKDWLHVHAKDNVRMSDRLALLVDNYARTLTALAEQDEVWYRDSAPLYDAFEPEYVRSALTVKELSLGALIFGRDEWQALGGSSSSKEDPLTAVFMERGLLESKTYLSPANYVTLFPTDNRKTRTHRSTNTYYISKKQVWSVTKCFPGNSVAKKESTAPPKDIRHVGEAERNTMLFQHIVKNTCDVAVGPLEYCGNGRVIKGPRGKQWIAVVRGDPSLPAAFTSREVKGIARRKAGLDKLGRRRKLLTKGQRDANMELARQFKVRSSSPSVSDISSNVTSVSGSSHPPSSDPPSSDFPSSDPPSLFDDNTPLPPLKKRRLSQDKHLALAGKENIEVEPRPRRRQRT